MWKTIQNFENYEISDEGQVRNIKTKRILKPSSVNGYLKVTLRKNNKGYSKYLHRLVAEAFLEGEGEVNHKDGNRANNSIENLEWVTHRENIQHSFSTLGRTPPRGRVQVCVQYFDGTKKEFSSIKDCAKYYNVDTTTIRDYIAHKPSPHRKVQAYFYYIYPSL